MAVVTLVKALRQRKPALRVRTARPLALADAALHVVVAVEHQIGDAAAVGQTPAGKDREPDAGDLLQFRDKTVVGEVAADEDAIDAAVAEPLQRLAEQ